MSPPSWCDVFHQTLSRLQAAKPGRLLRVAFVGVGHELRGDDAAGVVLARELDRRLAGRPELLAVLAGPAPENCTGALRRFAPDLLVLADAAELDALPGTIRWLSWQEAGGLRGSTHSLPLNLFAGYLAAELGCELLLMGIQPASLTLDAPLSPLVREAVAGAAATLADLLAAETLAFCGAPAA